MKTILLSFDIEEFDVPREHGVDLPIEEQVAISTEGTHRILDLMKRMGVRGTFYCTANFAQHSTAVVERIIHEGHEIASHGYYHWTFEPADLRRSKEALESLLGIEVIGYRQARMMPVPEEEIARAGYKYNSSLNPTFIPGRYMHLSAPRTHFWQEGVLQIPASVSPWVRFPLFWLSCHNLPYGLYQWLSARTLQHDGYLSVYFHPWEFTELEERPDLRLPYIIRHNSGQRLVERLERWISYFKTRGAEFDTYGNFYRHIAASTHA